MMKNPSSDGPMRQDALGQVLDLLRGEGDMVGGDQAGNDGDGPGSDNGTTPAFIGGDGEIYLNLLRRRGEGGRGSLRAAHQDSADSDESDEPHAAHQKLQGQPNGPDQV
jgi:hypothetical protein